MPKRKPTVTEKQGTTFKARLVVNGYSRHKGNDYDEIFFPIIKHTYIRGMLGLVAIETCI